MVIEVINQLSKLCGTTYVHVFVHCSLCECRQTCWKRKSKSKLGWIGQSAIPFDMEGIHLDRKQMLSEQNQVFLCIGSPRLNLVTQSWSILGQSLQAVINMTCKSWESRYPSSFNHGPSEAAAPLLLASLATLPMCALPSNITPLEESVLLLDLLPKRKTCNYIAIAHKMIECI